jgi:hypothetical protein
MGLAPLAGRPGRLPPPRPGEIRTGRERPSISAEIFDADQLLEQMEDLK